MKVLSVIGTRPNFMKLAPVSRALERHASATHIVVHTGQHYDSDMSAVFFNDLQLRAPNHHLGVGGGEAPHQVAMILERIGPILVHEAPDIVLVYGDVTSTMAAALAAAQRRFPVGHVEAGLRSRDRSMPEELNRVMTDHIADLLLAPSLDAVQNLRAEGIRSNAIRFVGNVMIDTLVAMLPAAKIRRAAARLALPRGQYVVATLHRPSNVDDPERLADLIGALGTLARERDVVIPLHPRTRHRMAALGIEVPATPRFHAIEPVGYVDMLSFLTDAALVITDSGGLQEETSFLGVPCLTVRPNTERPITCEQGTNRLVAPTRTALLEAAGAAFARERGPAPTLERWDGEAASRIVTALEEFVASARDHAELGALAVA